MKKRIINTIVAVMLGASMLAGCGAPAEKTAETVKETKTEASADTDEAGTVFKHENADQLTGKCPLENISEGKLKKADENREKMGKYLDLDRKLYLIANGSDGVCESFIAKHNANDKGAVAVAVNGLVIDSSKYRAVINERHGADVNVKDAKLPVNDMHACYSIAVEDIATNDLVIQKDLVLTFNLIDEKMAEELAGGDGCVIVNADGTVYGETE